MVGLRFLGLLGFRVSRVYSSSFLGGFSFRASDFGYSSMCMYIGGASTKESRCVPRVVAIQPL